MKNILFVCTGNSCRSQMAEGFGKILSNGKYNIKSAGTLLIGIHPMTVATMIEAGVDITDQTSDLLSRKMIDRCDYLITLCGSVRDKCTLAPPGVKHIHWEIENPDVSYASVEDRKKGFARIRDEIKKRVENLLIQIDKGEI